MYDAVIVAFGRMRYSLNSNNNTQAVLVVLVDNIRKNNEICKIVNNSNKPF